MLLVHTVAPIVICAVLASPLPILHLAGSPNLRYCTDECWKVVGAFLFLVYPTVSIISIASFNCQHITDDVSLLVADYREPCPNDNPGGFLFIYSVICVIVFPLGIILGAFWMMWYFKVPQLAKQKVNQARIHSMVLTFIKQRADHVMEMSSPGRLSTHPKKGSRAASLSESRRISLAQSQAQEMSESGTLSRRRYSHWAQASSLPGLPVRRRVSFTPSLSVESVNGAELTCGG
eukprot:1524076-Rhodomonas_salina.1